MQKNKTVVRIPRKQCHHWITQQRGAIHCGNCRWNDILLPGKETKHMQFLAEFDPLNSELNCAMRVTVLLWFLCLSVFTTACGSFQDKDLGAKQCFFGWKVGKKIRVCRATLRVDDGQILIFWRFAGSWVQNHSWEYCLLLLCVCAYSQTTTANFSMITPLV